MTDKRLTTYKETAVRLIIDFSVSKTDARRLLITIVKCQPRIIIKVNYSRLMINKYIFRYIKVQEFTRQILPI